MPSTNDITKTTFADNSTVMAVGNTHVSKKLQQATDTICNWDKDWGIGRNGNESYLVNFTYMITEKITTIKTDFWGFSLYLKSFYGRTWYILKIKCKFSKQFDSVKWIYISYRPNSVNCSKYSNSNPNYSIMFGENPMRTSIFIVRTMLSAGWFCWFWRKPTNLKQWKISQLFRIIIIT